MINALLAKIFGTKSERELKQLKPVIKDINELAHSFETFSDAELSGKTE